MCHYYIEQLKMEKDYIRFLILKCLEGSASEEEHKESYEWIHKNEENYGFYVSVREAWVASGIACRQKYYDTDKAWKKLASRSCNRMLIFKHFQKPGGWINVAASILLIMFAGALTYHLLNTVISRREVQDFMVEAPYGAKALVTMKDDTKIWLNAGSRIWFSSGYAKSNRDVQLEGEAFFEIEPGNKHPFIVHSSTISIEAIGTSFNVKAYPDEETVETTLVSGLAKVGVEKEHGKREHMLLRPNQTITIVRQHMVAGQPLYAEGETEVSEEKPVEPLGDPEYAQLIDMKTKPPVVRNVNTQLYTSWIEKRWVFERIKMSELTITLGRKYDVEFIFLDEEVKDYHLTGTIEQETLEQLLRVIRQTIPMDYSIDKKKVTISLNEELKEKYDSLVYQPTY